MNRLLFYILMLLCINTYSQTVCSSVVIGEKCDLRLAQDYLKSVNARGLDLGIQSPVTDTFQIADMCVVDSVVILKLIDVNKALKYYEYVLFGDTGSLPLEIILLSKESKTLVNGERLELGKRYLMTISAYFPHFISPSFVNIPVMIDDTAHYILLMSYNFYHSPNIRGKYYVGSD